MVPFASYRDKLIEDSFYRSLIFVINPNFLWNDGAGDGFRTRDLKLGKLALYLLSYARLIIF